MLKRLKERYFRFWRNIKWRLSRILCLDIERHLKEFEVKELMWFIEIIFKKGDRFFPFRISYSVKLKEHIYKKDLLGLKVATKFNSWNSICLWIFSTFLSGIDKFSYFFWVFTEGEVGFFFIFQILDKWRIFFLIPFKQFKASSKESPLSFISFNLELKSFASSFFFIYTHFTFHKTFDKIFIA